MSNMIFGAGGGKPKPPKRTADTLVADDTVEILLAISEGKIVGLRNKTNPEQDFFVAGTPVQGVSGDWNYEGFVVEQYPGDPVGTTPVHMTLGGFAENVNVGVPLATGAAVVRQTSTGQIDAIDVRLRIDALYEQNEKGIFEDDFIYSIRYRAQGSSTWLMALPANGGSSVKSKFTGKTTRPYPFEVRIPVDRIAVPYEIQVIMYNDDNDTENVVSATWESFQEIDNEPRTYPGTALIRFLGKATDQFSSIPLLEGIYEGRIVNVPVTYNTTTKTYSGTWDGTFKEAFTDETVWILADLITNPRYGYQRYNPNVSVDWPSFYATAVKANQLVSDGNGGQRRRHTFNGIISEARPGKQALLYVAGTMNSTIYDDGQGKLYLAMDSNDAVEQVFVPENITEDGFNYSFTDVNTRYNQITGTFINPAINWEPDRRLRSVQADIDANGVVPYDFLAVGCTNEAELLAAINYKLLTSLTEKIQLNFRTTRAGYLTRPYGVIGVSDINMGWGIHGRIKSISGNVATLRDPIYFETTGAKVVTLQGSTGVVTFNINVGATGYATTLTRTSGTSLASLPANAAFVIGEPKPFRVMKVTEVEGQPDLYDIYAMEMNRDKYGDMLVVDIDELVAGSNLDRLEIAPPTNVNVEVVWTPTSNGLTPKFNISWDRSTTRGVRSYVIYASRNGEPDQLVGSTTGSGYEWLSPLSGFYKISVMARSFLGTQSMPAYATDLDFTNPTPVAGFNPSGVQVEGGGTTFVGTDPTFVWDPVDPAQLRATEVEGTPNLTDLDDPMLRDYRVRIKTTGDVLLRTEYVDQPRYTYNLDKNVQDGGARRSFKVGVSVRDRFGAFSNESVISVTNAVPALPTVVATKFFGGFELKFTQPDDKDFRGYRVWMSQTSGFTANDASLVFDGPGNATITGTSNGTYYYRYAAYDEFGKTGLTVSSQQSIVLDRLVDLFDTGPNLNDKFDEIETAIDDLETVYGSTVSAAASATAAATSAANAAASQASAASAKTAAEAAQALAESAKTAAQSAQTAAAASQSAAASSASAAATSATNASTANTNAQAAATTASTAATNASNANTLAQAAKTAAETAATNSAASATAASGYATTASTANTNAQAAKTAAQSAQTAAAAAATAASGSATLASGYATTASNEADEAAGSASAASASAVVARTTLAGMFPSEMAQTDQWVGLAGGSPASIASESAGNFTSVVGVGTVWQSNTTLDNLLTRGVFTPVSGRIYELEALVRAVAANTSGTALIGSMRMRSLDEAYATGPSNYTPAAVSGFINGYSGSNSGHSTSWTIWKARWTAPASGLPAYVRPEMYFNAGPPGNQQMQVAYFKVTDVTSQMAAEGSASAAATSASGASISATDAGTSASAASTSATNAATSAGAASTSAGAASTSATNAASSASTATTQANTATTQATAAAGSATAAGGSATAAAGSATAAATSATAAGNSATSAAASQVSARSAAASVFPSGMDTNENWVPGAGDPASTASESSGNFTTVSGIGPVWQSNTGSTDTLASRGVVPAVDGRTIRVEIKLRALAANSTGSTVSGAIDFLRLDDTYANIGSVSGSAVGGFNSSYSSTTGLGTSWVVWKRDFTITSPTYSWVRPRLYVNSTTGNQQVQVAYFLVRDLTEQLSAASFADAAATSASNASTSQTAAGSSASAAATSATNAATSAGAASTSAGAASTSATNASNSASTATTQANNASTSATAAAGSATAAGGSATAAAGSATAAATSATNAGNSASSAAASAVSARSVAVRMMPERVSEYDNFTTQSSATPDAATSLSTGTVQTDSVEGDVYQNAGLLQLFTKGVLAVGTGRTFRVTLRTKVTTNGTSNITQLGFQALDSTYASLASVQFTTVDASAVVADGWQEFTATATSAQAIAANAGAVYLRARARVNVNAGGTTSGATSQISVFRFEDITNVTAAQGSADAAATSASAAGTSATAAGTSAGAASTSATNAATSAGAAATSAGAASTSASNAATSATTATTQANNASTSATAAAGSATAAGGSATAAAGSASSAATSATNAGNSATAADASYLAARSQAATLVPSDFTNQAQWIGSPSGDPASTAAEGSGNFTTVSGVGAVWQSNAAADAISPRGLIASPVVGRRYRFEVTFRGLAANTSGSNAGVGIAIHGLDDTFTNTGALTIASVAGFSNSSNTTSGAPTSWTTYKGDWVVPGSPPAYARPRFYVNNGSGNQQVQVSSFIVRDITEMTAAAGSADAAATSASSASTSATDAGNSATAASGSATTASTQAGLAATSAGAASTSATNAATSASTATTQANTATTQATNAANSATAASGSATSASGSASNAATSATNAGNSASSAAASAVVARSTAASLLPSSMETSEVWLPSNGGDPATATGETAGKFISVSGIGMVWQSDTGATDILAARGVIPAIPGRTYRLEAMVRALAANSTGSNAAGAMDFVSLDSAYSNASGLTMVAVSGFNRSYSSTTGLGTSWVTWKADYTVPGSPTYAYIRPRIYVNQSTGNQQVQVQYLMVKDITEQNAAQGYADAASTSASSAGTSATNAGNSATAANTSATNAASSAGAASTSAGAASTSASNAATSASTATTQANAATTQATNAANSATAAGGSATAASGSASAAATSATAAGNSATSAETSRVAARSTASTLLPSSMNSNEIWSPTNGVGDPASVTAVTDANFVTDGTYGRVWQSGTGSIQWLSPRGVITAVAGRTYRAEVLIKGQAANSAGAATADGRLRWRRMNGDFTSENTVNGTNPAGYVSVVPSTTTGVPTSWTVWRTEYTVPASPTFTYLRPELYVNNASGNQQVRVAYFLITDMTEVSAASGFADAASTSASAAGTSATNAGNSASAAATSATNASTSAGAASTSAGAASTSATNAATSASTATTQANNASTSAGAAATSATNAGNSATAASGSASAAATSATAAGNSATASEASNISAKSVANRLIPERPSVAQDFTTTVTGDPASSADITSGTVVSVSGEGDVRQFTTLTNVYTKGVRAVGTNRTFRLTVRARTAVNGTNGRLRTTFHALSNTYTNLGAATVVTQDATWVAADGWQEFTQTITSAQLLAIASAAAYVRPRVFMNENTSGTDSGATTQLAFMRFEDISSEQAAADSASAAATSATAASTSATTAGTQAGVATTQASNASTSASNASTSATNAASSATTASGHATNASTYATNAATSATNAGTSATNAATSATNASNSASSAAASATLAAQVGNMAINPNPYFAGYTTTTGLPGSWTNWSGTASTYSRVTGILSPYGVNIPGAAGADVGIRSPTMMPAMPNGWVVIEAVVKLVSGTFSSAGVFLQMTGTGANSFTLTFNTDPDINGNVVGNGTTGQTYRFAKMVKVTGTPTAWTAAYIYAQSHGSSQQGGSNASANSIDWYSCLVRPATAGEIETGIARGGSASLSQALTQIVTDANATYATASALTSLTSTVNGHTSSITTLSSTQTTLDGKMNALYNVDVSTSSSKAGFVISAGAVSYFDAYSDRFRIYDGTSTKVPVFEVVGGVVKIKSLQVPTITASMISVTSLSAITATIGTLRTATTGARTEIKDNLIEVYDSSNVLRVKMGVW